MRLVQRKHLKMVSLVLVSLALLVLSACGGSSSSGSADQGGGSGTANEKKEKVVIDFWSTPPFEQKEMEELIAKYMKEVNPNVQINLTLLPFNAIDEKVNVALASDSFPDLYSDGIQRLGALAVRGVLAPLEPYMTPEFKNEDYVAGIRELSQYQGKQYMVLNGMNTFPLIINRALFEKAGATDLLPDEKTRAWTREQFAKAIDKISALGGGVYGFGIGMGAVDHDKFMDNFIYNDGDGYTDAAYKKVIYNSEQNKKNLAWIVNVINSKSTLPGSVGNKITNVFELFKQGKIGVMSANITFYGDVQKGKKDGTIKEPVNIMFAHYPTNDGKVGKTFIGAANGFVVKQQADQRKMEEAAKFALWFSGPNNETVKSAFKQKGIIPARRSFQSILDDAELQKLSTMPEKSVTPVFLAPGYAKLRNVLFSNMQAAILKEKTPQKALDDFATEAQKLVDEASKAK